MRRILPLIIWQLGLLAGGRLFADVVTLNDGRQISGLVESGNIQELHIKVGDQSQTIDIHQVETIQFGVSSSAPPPAKAADLAHAAPGTAPAQPNSLILKDGTHVAGRWWSIDASDVHFLVNRQLQHYSRPDVSAVTFGEATLPPPVSSPPASSPPASSPPPSSPPPPATLAPPPARAAQPSRPPSPARSSAGPPPQPPTATRPSSSAPPPATPTGVSQPEQVGMVYFWNGKFLFPLERSQAVERKDGSTQYWEIPGAQSRVRVSEASTLMFVLRLPKGIDPRGYSLFPLVTVNGSRRTQSQPGHRDGLVTWPVGITINDASSLMTYALAVRDLPAGEYSFSPSSSNDSYCFAVEPSAPGQ